MITKELKNELRKLAENSTKVVSWYPHSQYDRYHPGKASVRGPFGRWFLLDGGECKNGSPELGQGVADLYDDAKFAAAAMNNLVPLLDRVEELEKSLYFVHLHLESMDKYSVVIGARHAIEEALNGTIKWND